MRKRRVEVFYYVVAIHGRCTSRDTYFNLILHCIHHFFYIKIVCYKGPTDTTTITCVEPKLFWVSYKQSTCKLCCSSLWHILLPNKNNSCSMHWWCEFWAWDIHTVSSKNLYIHCVNSLGTWVKADTAFNQNHSISANEEKNNIKVPMGCGNSHQFQIQSLRDNTTFIMRIIAILLIIGLLYPACAGEFHITYSQYYMRHFTLVFALWILI